MSWIAYVDESIRARLGLYVLAGAVLESDNTGSVRDQMIMLSQRGMPFHWRLEQAVRRASAIELVAGLTTLHVVVIGMKLEPSRQERGRRHCLAEWLYRLEDAGVTRVWMESRGLVGDRRDIKAVDAFRTQQRIGTIHVDHALRSDEPLLWLPDIVAGAVSESETSTPRYRDRLAGVLTEHRITLQ